jgi:hypothetical protein
MAAAKIPDWERFFREVDEELCSISTVFWTMTSGREHRVEWVHRKGKWGLSPILPPKGSLRTSYLSCIHRIPERTRFWKKLHSRMGDGGRVVVATQGCQGTYPVPPRLAGAIADAPSVGTLLQEMSNAGLSACCAKVHLVRRAVPRAVWRTWLLQGCFSDMDYCDEEEIEGYCSILPKRVEVTMAYYILVGLKLGPQSGLIDIRPSKTHGLSACARADLKVGWSLLSVPFHEAPKGKGKKTNEWHRRKAVIGIHRCSTIYRLLNNSKTPNCRLTTAGVVQTTRGVRAGEELTLDYSAEPS